MHPEPIDESNAADRLRHAFKFKSKGGDIALMISEGNRAFWEEYGRNISIIGWAE